MVKEIFDILYEVFTGIIYAIGPFFIPIIIYAIIVIIFAKAPIRGVLFNSTLSSIIEVVIWWSPKTKFIEALDKGNDLQKIVTIQNIFDLVIFQGTKTWPEWINLILIPVYITVFIGICLIQKN